MRTLARSAIAGAAACLLLGLGGTGCSKTSGGIDLTRVIHPRWPLPSPGPVPNSPANVLRLLEWCYNNRSPAPCRELFTEDFRWLCSPLDSTGAAWRDPPWTRDDELISTTHLFVGGSVDQPPASIIRLLFDRSFFVHPDPFFTHFPDNTLRDPSGVWHKSIRTTVTLQIGTDDGNWFEIRGHAAFYFVRGDSALIPEELRLRGFGPDPGRWYIRRWDDETLQDEGLAHTRPQAQGAAAVATQHAVLDPQPVKNATWCRLKALYR